MKVGEWKNNLTIQLKEALAAYAHEAWSDWISDLFEKSKRMPDGTVRIPKWAVDRWKRQMIISYEDLPENEKEPNRGEADEMIDIMKSFL